MILTGRRIVVTGVLTEASIAFHVAKLAQSEGAEILLTSFGRAMSLTRAIARRLPEPPEVLTLDVRSSADLARLATEVDERWDRVDGLVHAVAYAPPDCFGTVLEAAWPDVAVALEVSAYSLKALACSLRPLLRPQSAIVALGFDGKVAWPFYGWMGVAKAALESTARYLARDLGPDGVRVNVVNAGPLRTLSSRAVGDVTKIGAHWAERAPLGWDPHDAEPVARACVALLSDWFPATSGEIVHVDGGYHAMGG